MSPHPYRLALSCLDTPPVTPESPPRKRRWFPTEAVVIACALVTAGSSLACLRVFERATSRIELGPAALARLTRQHKAERKTERTVRRETPRPPAPPVAAVQAPLLRVTGGGGMHDPKTLLATAKKLQALGVDLTVSEVTLAQPITAWSDRSIDFFPAGFVPIYGPNQHLDALQIGAIPAASPLRAAGFAEGDQLLGIDGYDLADNTIRDVNVIPVRSRGWAVVEIARANHHVVLSIRWPVP